MKYRIKQVGNRFYAQYKWLGLWLTYADNYCGHDLDREFSNIDAAEKFLDEQLFGKNNTVIIHKYPRFNPDAVCNVTPALKQSQCGTTCCTPSEEE